MRGAAEKLFVCLDLRDVRAPGLLQQVALPKVGRDPSAVRFSFLERGDQRRERACRSRDGRCDVADLGLDLL